LHFAQPLPNTFILAPSVFCAFRHSHAFGIAAARAAGCLLIFFFPNKAMPNISLHFLKTKIEHIKANKQNESTPSRDF
jgi:hypothetical protein